MPPLPASVSSLSDDLLSGSECVLPLLSARRRALREKRSQKAIRALQDLWAWALVATPQPTPAQSKAKDTQPKAKIALCALGSLARSELGPQSDLDLIVIYDDTQKEACIAAKKSAQLWYALWDAKLTIDYSTRTLAQCEKIAREDVSAACGLLDLSFIAGDENVYNDARSRILQQWRKIARLQLDNFSHSRQERQEIFGELPSLIDGDIKEAIGGLRDGVLIRAVVASWLAERPSIPWESSYHVLLDVRDSLQSVSGRHAHKLVQPYQQEVAQKLCLENDDELLKAVFRASRQIRSACGEVFRAATRANERPQGLKARIVRGKALPPKRERVGEGIVKVGGEITLEHAYDVHEHSLWRLARESARHNLPISPLILSQLAQSITEFSGCADPFCRSALLDILACGKAQIPMWEQLHVAGVMAKMIPIWAHIENVPQRSTIHRHTVDRHCLEVVASLGEIAPYGGNASRVGSASGKPRGKGNIFHIVDKEYSHALLLASFLHDIGKEPGVSGHSERGADIARKYFEDCGWDSHLAHRAELLIRHHLLLGELSRTADPADPATHRRIWDALEGDIHMLECLYVLTVADARSCVGAWDEWRAQLLQRFLMHVISMNIA